VASDKSGNLATRWLRDLLDIACCNAKVTLFKRLGSFSSKYRIPPISVFALEAKPKLKRKGFLNSFNMNYKKLRQLVSQFENGGGLQMTLEFMRCHSVCFASLLKRAEDCDGFLNGD